MRRQVTPTRLSRRRASRRLTSGAVAALTVWRPCPRSPRRRRSRVSRDRGVHVCRGIAAFTCVAGSRRSCVSWDRGVHVYRGIAAFTCVAGSRRSRVSRDRGVHMCRGIAAFTCIAGLAEFTCVAGSRRSRVSRDRGVHDVAPLPRSPCRRRSRVAGSRCSRVSRASRRSRVSRDRGAHVCRGFAVFTCVAGSRRSRVSRDRGVHVYRGPRGVHVCRGLAVFTWAAGSRVHVHLGLAVFTVWRPCLVRRVGVSVRQHPAERLRVGGAHVSRVRGVHVCCGIAVFTWAVGSWCSRWRSCRVRRVGGVHGARQAPGASASRGLWRACGGRRRGRAPSARDASLWGLLGDVLDLDGSEHVRIDDVRARVPPVLGVGGPQP